MRIGIDARPLSYPLTGIGFYLKCLLDTLQKTDNKHHYCLISNAPIHYKLTNPKWSKIEGRLSGKLMSTLWMQVWGPVAVLRRKIDLFWSPRHHLPLLLPGSVKKVLTIHDLVHRRYPNTMAWPNLAVERLLMRQSVRRADAIITDSMATARDLNVFYRVEETRIHVIFPGVPEIPCAERAGRKEPRNDPYPETYFLFVGTLDPRKNFLRILKAFESAHGNCLEPHLLIVGGEGWKNKDFLATLECHPLKPFIHLTGYVTRKELGCLYRNALCLLFPSLCEGFGFPILEAMACGTPVITSKVSSMPEVAGDAAILVDPEDVSAIAEAMKRVAQNSDFRNQLIQQGHKQIKKFSWRKCAAQTLEIFETIMTQ